MRQQLKDKICRAILTTLKLKRSAGRDPIELSEMLGDAVELIFDMETEASGISSLPEAFQAEEPFDIDDPTPAKLPSRPMLDIPKAQSAVVPENAGKRIIMPGDAEYSESKPADLPERRIISAVQFQRRPIRRPGANVPEKQYWDEAGLIDVIMQNTPDKVTFQIEGPDGEPMSLPAVKNVINQQGMGSVLLTYRHPSISELTDGSVTVDLIAKWPFSLYAKEIDFTEAMEGPKGIMAQLTGMYKVRPSVMAPVVGPEPASLSRSTLKNSPMQDHIQMEGEYDDSGRLINPGGKIDYTPCTGQVYDRNREGMRHNNDSLAPTGSRFDKR